MTDNNTNVDTPNNEPTYNSLEEAAFDVNDSGSDLNDVFTTGEEGKSQESESFTSNAASSKLL